MSLSLNNLLYLGLCFVSTQGNLVSTNLFIYMLNWNRRSKNLNLYSKSPITILFCYRAASYSQLQPAQRSDLIRGQILSFVILSFDISHSPSAPIKSGDVNFEREIQSWLRLGNWIKKIHDIKSN